MAINIRKILFVDELLQSWQAIKREKWRYLFLFFQFVVFCGLWKYCNSDTFLVVNCALCAVMAIRQGVDIGKIMLVVLVYAIMMIAPIVTYGINELLFRQYVGYGIRILTACFIASYFRYDFISKFENLVFMLAYISIPLFTLQQINPHVYDFLSPITHAIEGGDFDFYRKGEFLRYQYFFVYRQNAMVYYRNSGFMWEPGAFAMMLTWSMLFCVYLNKFKLSRRMIVYVVAMLTTFSLMGFSSVIVLAVLFLAWRTDWKKISYVIIGGGLLFFVFTQTSLFSEQRNMMAGKAGYYTYSSEAELHKGDNTLAGQQKQKSVGRIAQFFILKDIILEDPFGQGMNEGHYASANGFINLIVRWGINAIILLAIAFYFFSKMLSQYSRQVSPWYIIIITMIVLLMPAISNPIGNRILFLTLVIFPLFAKRQML